MRFTMEVYGVKQLVPGAEQIYVIFRYLEGSIGMVFPVLVLISNMF